MSDSSKPTVCVIIPTMQRYAFLEETLRYLDKTNYDRSQLEVFIADGGSTDGSAELVKQYQASSDISYHWYSDPDLRVSAARNYAIKHTDAEILVFLDDDCITTPDWIVNLTQPLIDNTCDIAAGTDMAPEDDPFFAQCEDVAFSSLIGSGGVRNESKAALADFCPMTCNMAMRRDKMIDVGGFDEHMRAVEDTEFVYRSKMAGMNVQFVPNATVKHRRRASLRAICFHNYIRGYGRTYLSQRYKAIKQRAFFIPAAGMMGGVFLFMAGFLYPLAWWVLGIGLLGYLGLLVIAGIEGLIRLKKASALFIVPFLVAVHHIWYALGTLHGPLTKYRKMGVSYKGNLSDPFGKRDNMLKNRDR